MAIDDKRWLTLHAEDSVGAGVVGSFGESVGDPAVGPSHMGCIDGAVVPVSLFCTRVGVTDMEGAFDRANTDVGAFVNVVEYDIDGCGVRVSLAFSCSLCFSPAGSSSLDASLHSK